MKKIIMLGVMAFAMSISSKLPAGVIVFNGGLVAYSSQQPINAVFTDSDGNSYQQTVYYNPAIGGVDIGNPGSYVSVYFPTLGSAYLWNNGYWVGEDGYYWNNGTRVYVGPNWNDHWHAYWGPRGGWYGGGYYGHGGWGHNDVNVNNFYGNRHDGWHNNEWHGGNDWHGGRGGDWHGGHEGRGGEGGHRR